MCCASTQHRLWQEETRTTLSCLDDDDDQEVSSENFVSFSFLSSPWFCCDRFLCRFLSGDRILVHLELL